MSGVFLISSNPGELRAGLVEDEAIVELHLHRTLDRPVLGGIFHARVHSIVPSIPAAFVDLGDHRQGFLPLDRAKPSQYPREGEALTVQIVKEAHGGKPPEVTRSLSIQGRYLVFTPQRPGLAVSRQLPGDERARLSTILGALVAESEGVVVRTHAAGASRERLDADLTAIRVIASDLAAAAQRAIPPARLDPVPSRLDLLLGQFGAQAASSIVDNAALIPELRRMPPALLASDAATRVDEDAFRDYGFEEAWDEVLAARVDLDGGAWLQIDECEAACLIDVNSGGVKNGRSGNAALAVNQLAAKAVARQIRLRGISGAIIVDFIPMSSRAARQSVEQLLKACTLTDPAMVEIQGWTRLGHLELTRKRSSASLAEALLTPPGARAPRAETTAYAVLRALYRLPVGGSAVSVQVHPRLAALFQTSFQAFFEEACRRSGRKIELSSDPSRDPATFDIAEG